MLRCTHCKTELQAEHSVLACASCGARFPVDDGIADFAEGEYYDAFDPRRDRLPEGHLRGLELEMEGAVRRIRDFYLPLISETLPTARRVLDVGCGNGVSVDTLRSAGLDAWGNDLSQLRKFQWRERASRGHLVVASALRLPFEDHYFDVVISSGVIEHIGVVETPAPHYSVSALPNQQALRAAYLAEVGRVVRPGGRIFLDCPHGSFPIDFWHGNLPGSPRFHFPSEPFLPSFGEIRTLVRSNFGKAVVRARSPRGRLQFRQAGNHLYGRILGRPVAAVFKLMEYPGLRWLAGTAFNPFLVVEVEKPAAGTNASC